MRRMHGFLMCLAAAAGGAAVSSIQWPWARAATPAPAASTPATVPTTVPTKWPEEERPETVIRMYRVRDIVRPIRDFHYESALVPPTMIVGPHIQVPDRYRGEGLFCGPSGNKEEEIDIRSMENVKHLADKVMANVDPDAWREAGGSIGSIREYGYLLVIDQTREGHARVEAFLNELRRVRNVEQSVALDAYWLLLDPEQLDGLLAKPAAGGVASSVAGREVDVTMLDAARKGGAGVAYAEAHLMTQCGQTVHLAAGRGRTAVVGLLPTIGTAVAAYEPRVEQVLAGLVLQATPTVYGETALVELRATASGWGPAGGPPARFGMNGRAGVATTQPDERPVTGEFESSGTVDRLNVPAHQFATTARVPLGKAVLAGGMTLEPSAAADGGDQRQLYLVLRVSASELGKR